MNLKNSQLDVDNWIKNTVFAILTNQPIWRNLLRVGEVSDYCRRYGEQSEKKVIKQRFRRRTSRCSFCSSLLSNQTGIDLQAAFDKKWI
jgi:hypothetical protein